MLLTTPLNGEYHVAMDFKKYLFSLDMADRQLFADRCDTTVGHLRNVAYGRTCGEKLAVDIERESNGAVRCEDLRPDVDWAYLRGTSTVNAENSQEMKAA